MRPVELLELRVATAFYGDFVGLRPVQEATIEPLLAGRNVVVASGTGSGKTEAVVAPLLSRYWREIAPQSEVALLYISPTKALVNDLERRLAPPLDRIGLRVGVRHGDRDDLTLSRKPHLLVTTPESLEVMLLRRDAALLTIRAIIIDEAHLLYNTQRGLQLSILIQRLKLNLGRDLQWAAISATIGNPVNLRNFLFGPAAEADFLSFATQRPILAKIYNPNSVDGLVGVVKRLVADQPRKLLVFADSRRECERLVDALRLDTRLASAVFAHYSSLSAEVREEVERRFAMGRLGICVATSTLELGIDIGDIDAIILWGVPGGVASFLQRIGRGNRREKHTNAICFVREKSEHPEGDGMLFMALLSAARDGRLPIQEPFALYGAVTQQCLNVIAQNGGSFTRVRDLCQMFEHQPHLDRATVEDVLNELATQGYLTRHGFKNQFGAGAKLYDLLDQRALYGNFPLGSQMVPVLHGHKVLGEIPGDNLLRLRSRDTLRFAGQHWTIKRLSFEGIVVTPSVSKKHALDPQYGGGSPPLDGFLVQHLWAVLSQLDDGVFSDLTKSLRAQLGPVLGLAEAARAGRLPFARTLGNYHYLTFAGQQINQAIAAFFGRAVYEAGNFCLSVPSPIPWNRVPEEPEAYRQIFPILFSPQRDETMFQRLLPAALSAREREQGWLKSQPIRATLSDLRQREPIEVDISLVRSLIY